MSRIILNFWHGAVEAAFIGNLVQQHTATTWIKRSGASLNHTDTGVDIELRCFREDEPADVDDTRDDDLNQIESDNESASAFDNIRLELSEYDEGHSFGEQRNSVNLGVADVLPGQLGRGINTLIALITRGE